MWKCPACNTTIQQSQNGATPRPHVVYRCPTCRLELVLNDDRSRLDLAPLPEDGDTTAPSEVTRADDVAHRARSRQTKS